MNTTKSVKTIRDAIEHADVPTIDILAEVYHYCAVKKVEPETTFWVNLKGATKKAWTDFATQHPYEPEERVDTSKWFPEDQSPQDREKQIAELMTSSYYVVRGPTSHVFYPIESATRTLGEEFEFNNLTPSQWSNIVAKFREQMGDEGYKIGATNLVRHYVDNFFCANHNVDHPKPVIFGQPDDGGYCIARRAIVEDETVPFENIQRLLAAMNDPEAFAAKLYGIASGRDISRQVLYVRGRGKDGKSSFFKAFLKVFGKPDVVTKSLAATHVANSSKFLAAEFKDIAFVLSPDNSNPAILLSEVVKSISGDDKVSFEKKYGGFGQYDSVAKLVVCSNYRPLVLKESHSTSRILYIEMDKPHYKEDLGSAEFTARCLAEMPGFLAYGRKCFEARFVNNMITLNDAARQTFEDLIGGERQEFYEFIYSKMVFDARGVLTSNELADALTDARVNNKHERTNYRNWIEELEGVGPARRKQVNGVRMERWSGIRLRRPADDLADEVAANG